MTKTSDLKLPPFLMHKGLTYERWFKFTLFEQMANIGMEIERTIHWRNAGNQEYSQMAFWRALELIDFTIRDPKNKKRLREIVRTRYALVDHFAYDNEYQSTDKQWQDYFYAFNYAAALQRGK
jgi:hypothetical protein